MPFGSSFNALKTHLSDLKLFDDLELKEWVKIAENSEKEFSPKPEDDKNEINRKESLQRWYSVQRFHLERKYTT